MILPRGNEMIFEEVWKDITGDVVENIADYYSISTYGRIYNRKTKTYLPQNIFYWKDKYITISLALRDGTHVYRQMHRLVLETFNPIENSNLYDANHKDGIKYHNWIWNLEWSTHKENMDHAWENSLFKFGKDRANTVYDDGFIRQICEYIQNGLSPKQVNDIVGSDISKLYHNIKNGHCRSNISKDYDFNNAYSRSVFSDTEKEKIAELVKANVSEKDILNTLGYTKDNCKYYDKLAALKRYIDKLR